MSDDVRDGSDGDQQVQQLRTLLSRRNLLVAGSGLGAAGIATGLTGVRVAGATPSTGEPNTPTPAITGNGFFGTANDEPPVSSAPWVTSALTPAVVPGTILRTVTAQVGIPAALGTGSSLVGVNGPPGGAYNSSGGALFFPLDIPPGGVLKQVDGYAFGIGSAAGGNWYIIGYDPLGNVSNLAALAADAGPGMVQRTFSGLNLTVGPTGQLVVDLAGTWVNYYAVAMSYQYVPATPGFHPIAPARVYDSRFNSPSGILAAGGNRTIAVSNAYNPGTNTVVSANVVPAGAVAVAYNLTVTDTSAAGYLQLAPGSAPAVTGSSINWAAGQTVANGGVVSLDSTRHVKAFAVASSTNVIIDVQGYYL